MFRLNKVLLVVEYNVNPDNLYFVCILPLLVANKHYVLIVFFIYTSVFKHFETQTQIIITNWVCSIC